MITPPLLLGATVVFWGAQTGLLLLALVVALALEGSRLVHWRWEFSRDDFDRLSGATSLLSWAVAGYLFVTADPSHALTVLFQWFPLLLAPLMLAQAYSTSDTVDVTGLFWTLRRRRAEGAGRRHAVNLSYIYLAACLLSAAAANVRTPWYYAGLCALAGCALWRIRSPRVSPLAWAGLLALVVALGYGGHLALRGAQKLVEARALEWVADLLRRDMDPFRSSTAIGSIGSLKLSDRIVLRLESPPGRRPPRLLREASYNLFNSPTWFAFDAGFEAVPPGGDGTVWRLGPARPSSETVTLSTYLRRGRGVLALPHGTVELDRLTAVGLSRNPLGAVKVKEGLGLAVFHARFDPAVSLDEAPNELDLRVPFVEAPVLSRVAHDLRLDARSPTEARDTIAAFFRDNFRYASVLRERPAGAAPLADFLLRSRAGHCEYFATATVLLLRAAGIPARYATGYSVQEWSRLENRWIVRARHAHSWALVYLDGAWRDFDTTPPVWADEEQGLAPFWEPLADLASWAGFLFSRWRWGERGDGFTRYLGWLLIPLVLILAWRLYFRTRRIRLGAPVPILSVARAWTGEDSEFYAIEDRLRALGLPRHRWEPLGLWIRRIEAAGLPSLSTEPLREIVALHYRYRFDADGLSVAERETLRARARTWLERHREIPSPG